MGSSINKCFPQGGALRSTVGDHWCSDAVLCGNDQRVADRTSRHVGSLLDIRCLAEEGRGFGGRGFTPYKETRYS